MGLKKLLVVDDEIAVKELSDFVQHDELKLINYA